MKQTGNPVNASNWHTEDESSSAIIIDLILKKANVRNN